MHITAALITNAALSRPESRGAHIRLDISEKKQDWEQRWIVFQEGTMKVRNDLYEHNQIKEHASPIL